MIKTQKSLDKSENFIVSYQIIGLIFIPILVKLYKRGVA